MSTPDPRDIVSAMGRLTGNEDIADAAISGRLNATECAPLVAGLVDGVVRSILAPMVGIEAWSGFNPTQRPISGVVTLLDGTKLRIAIGAEA